MHMRIVFTGIFLVGLAGCAVDSAIAPVVDLKTDTRRFGVMQIDSHNHSEYPQFVYCDVCPGPTTKTPFNSSVMTDAPVRGLIVRDEPEVVAKPHERKPAKIVKATPEDTYGELLYIAHFGFDSAEISMNEKILIRQRVLRFHKSPGKITLIGYTDNRGSKRYNDWLAMKRAEAVKEYLVKNGMDPERINVTSFGKCCYLQMNSTRAGRLANRRVEIRRAVDRG